MKHRFIHSLVVGIFVASSACGDDGLGERWDPPGPPDDEFGDGFPIRPGDTFWYMFAHTTRPEQTSCGGGEPGSLVCGEKQSSGHVCLKVSTVEDTETSDYKDAPETVVNAQVKIVGHGGGDIVFDDLLATTPDSTVVDAALEPLWLKQLAVATRGHGFLSPTEQAFSTREAPVPGNQELAHLPFFDVRVSSKWDWGGWDLTNEDCASLYLTEDGCPDTCQWDASGGGCMSKAYNYLNGILSYFIRTFGSSYYVDASRFYVRHPFNPVCDGYTTSSDCIMAQCEWDWAANECIVLHSLDVRWRHDLSTGEADLQGPVIHSLRLEYNENGVIRSGSENIVPDPNPNAPTASDLLNSTECGGTNACATGSLTFYPDPWADAYCTF